MRHTIIAGLLLATMTLAAEAPACRITGGTLDGWTGTLAELAGVEASYQQQYATTARKPFPEGASLPSDWRGRVTCATAS